MTDHKHFFPCSIVGKNIKKYGLWDTCFTLWDLKAVGNSYQESSIREHIKIGGYLEGCFIMNTSILK
jgi:hypothetical protein